jgi:Mrp family chromosome partitioning ATPase
MNAETGTKISLRTPQLNLVSREIVSSLALLVRLIDDRGSMVVHITSSRHGEGTTTVARELAAAAARSRWCKVALLEADRPAEGDPLAVGLPPIGLLEGYSETGKGPPLRRLRMGESEIGIGTLSSAVAMTPKVECVRGFYNWVRANYTLAIVDCPPVQEPGDSAVMAPIADGTILVVEAEKTRIAEIRRARDSLEQWGATLLGTVLNKRRDRTPRFLKRMF